MSENAASILEGVRMNHNLDAVRKVAFSLIARMEGHKPAHQVQGLAVAFVTVCKTIGIDPHELASQANRMLADADRGTPHTAALRDYALTEISRSREAPKELRLEADA